MLVESWSVIFIVSVLIFGAGGFAIGNALAQQWQSALWIIPYSLLLALLERFLIFALFKGELLSLVAYLFNSAIILLFALFAYRLRLTHKMISQYPWLYERTGLLNWQTKENS